MGIWVHIASDRISDRYYVGDIFEVIVYAGPLSETEVVPVDGHLTGTYPQAR